ncbi:MAG: hypothetical protein JF609_04910 [Verrucomicrobia bacterium]|nr:hypothetical protein [Verrucomicrobiota bacterium]
MKIKIAIIILAIVCIGLGIALFATKKQSDDQHAEDVKTITAFSNQIVEVDGQLKDLSQANLALTNDLALSRQQTLDLSNSLATATSALAETKSTLVDAQAQVTNLTIHVNDLEAQNKVLDQQAEELTNTIAQLNEMIAITQAKLTQSETNNAFLQGELQRQMTQKAELERKFNDVNEVRAQVRKLADELFVARRVQLSKTDVGNRKGAELLMARTPQPGSASRTPAGYDLNVEVGSDGSVRVIPPIGGTNSPAH